MNGPAHGPQGAEGLLLRSVVRLQAPTNGTARASESWGSGFLVAPGWVLTSAHVLWEHGGAGPPRWRGAEGVGIRWRGRLCRGEAVLAYPGPEQAGWEGLAPWPDVALVLVPELADAPCVRLSEEWPESNAPLVYAGYTDILSSDDVWSRENSYHGSSGEYGQTVIAMSGDVPPGLSGGPVLDRMRAAVCAVVTTTRSVADTSKGGFATPVAALRAAAERPGVYVAQAGVATDGAPDAAPWRVLETMWRAHDLSHWEQDLAAGEQETWVEVATRHAAVDAGEPDPRFRAQLLGWLARLPPAEPGAVKEALRAVVSAPLRQVDPRGWRDGVDLLHGSAGVSRAGQWLRYAVVAAELSGGGPVAEELRTWAEVRMAGLPRTARLPLPVAGPSQRRVVLRIDPSADGDGTYRWRIHHRGEQLAQQDRRVTEQQLEAQLAGPLAAALADGDHGIDRARLEVVVPVDLFDLPVPDWRIATAVVPGTPWIAGPVGRRRAVVVRDLARYGEHDEELLGPWRRRWDVVTHSRPTPQHLSPEHLGNRERLHGRLHGGGDEEVPFWDGPASRGAGREAARAALAAGYAIAVWRSSGTAEGAEDEDFTGFVRSLVVQAPDGTSLPGQVHAQRNGLDDLGTTGLLLLYDDPYDLVDERELAALDELDELDGLDDLDDLE